MTHPYTGELDYKTKDTLPGIASDRNSEDKPKAFANSILQYDTGMSFVSQKILRKS